MDEFVEKAPTILKDMQKKVIMYGSPKTVSILAMLYQHTYIGSGGEVGKGTEFDNYKLMLYIANLIASLK
ncbi:hypothetical protein P4715_15100, partial [Listeria monocytogenes]|nr:hypothetical protein [Listeria monocytogenes]